MNGQITIIVEGPAACGKTTFINSILLPALEAEGKTFVCMLDGIVKGKPPEEICEYIIIERR